MLLVGNHGTGKATSAKGMFKGLTQDEYRSHFALWCILNAPLLTSCDLRNVSKEDFAIITDTTLIAINQDELGVQAKLISKKNGRWNYTKQLSGHRTAIMSFNVTNKKLKSPGFHEFPDSFIDPHKSWGIIRYDNGITQLIRR